MPVLAAILLATNCNLKHPFKASKRRKCQAQKNCVKRGRSIKSIDKNHYKSYSAECQGSNPPSSVNDYWRNTVGLEGACSMGVLCDEYERVYGSQITAGGGTDNTAGPGQGLNSYTAPPRPNPYLQSSTETAAVTGNNQTILLIVAAAAAVWYFFIKK